jgi:hypothetical protein
MTRKHRMVLAAPRLLLTPPTSSSPEDPLFRSYSAQIRFQNEERYTHISHVKILTSKIKNYDGFKMGRKLFSVFFLGSLYIGKN